MPAIPAYVIEPIWQQLPALLPRTQADHPLGVITAPANRHDSPFLSETLDNVGEMPERASVHLDVRCIVERTNSWHNAHKKLLW